MSDGIATVLFGLGLLAAVGAGEVLRAKAGWTAEASRRVVHALAGLLVVVSPRLFAEPWGIYALALLFVGVNLYAIPRRIFPGMHGIARRSVGTVTFPLALLVALVTCWTLAPERVYVLQAAFLVLALADPLASLVGTRSRRAGRFVIAGSEKSVAGSAAFFVAAWGLGAGALVVFGPYETATAVLAAFSAAAVATGAEVLGRHGWDNLFVVVAVVVVLTWLDGRPGDEGRLAAVAGVSVAFGAAAYAVRFLDLGGAVAASGLAFSVLALGGWAWAAPGATFFVLSSLLSRLGRRRKRGAESLAEKGSRRDAGQVYANGGVAWLLLVAHVFVPHEAFYWGFVGAFAAAAADTWGTEVGTLVGGPTRSVWGGRRVLPGTSGGVSVAGTLGALAGAAVVVASAVPFAGPYLGEVGLLAAVGLVVGSGFAAAFVDSIIGATVQAVYRDPGTGGLTERAQPAGPVRGLRWITNDRVNLACTLAGALGPLVVLVLR